MPRKSPITKVTDPVAAPLAARGAFQKRIAPEILARARAALAAWGRDPDLALSIMRMRDGEVATLAGADVVVKIYLGADAMSRAAQAQAGQARAAGLLSASAYPLAPEAGPVVDAAFAMTHMDGVHPNVVLGRLRTGSKTRFMAEAGAALSALHARTDGETAPATGWPSKNLIKRSSAAPPPWPGFEKTAEQAAARAWDMRHLPSPLGSRHGDLHVDNMIITGKGVVFIDFKDFTRSPVHFEIARFLASVFSRTRLSARMEKDETGMPRAMTRAFMAAYGTDIVADAQLAALVSVFLHTGALRLASRGLTGPRKARLARSRAVISCIEKALG